VNDRAKKTRQTPLHLACMEGHTDVVHLLADTGAELNPVDWHKKTPLDYVDMKTHAKLAAFLEWRGAKHGKR